MVDNKTLRANARAQLGGSIFKDDWLIMVIFWLIVDAVITALGSTAVGLLLANGFIWFITSRITCALACNEKPFIAKNFTDVVSGEILQTLLLGLMHTLFIVLWSLLLIVPGIIKAYEYALAFYLRQDDSSMTWRETLQKSGELMEGYKGQLFALDLSFIGWYILGALCFGVGVLFVIPYHMQARANFYLARIAQN